MSVQAEYSKAQLAVAEVIYEYFRSCGLPSPQACGIVAQPARESRFNPSATGDGGQAKGLFQMHPDRRAVIKARGGFDMLSGDVAEQCKGVWWELNHVETAALAALRRTHDAFGAGSVMCSQYERPASHAEAGIRGKIAAEFYAYFAAAK